MSLAPLLFYKVLVSARETSGQEQIIQGQTVPEFIRKPRSTKLVLVGNWCNF
jgi:hypothetical protein